MQWHPTIDTPEWKKAIVFYVDLMKKCVPGGATSNVFNQNLTLMQTGLAAMWIDATVARSMLESSKQSKVVRKIRYAPSPIAVTPNGSHCVVVIGVRDA